MLITPEYLAQQQKYHEERPDYGQSGHKWAEHIRKFAEQLGTRDILDYGCGKETLQRALPFPIHMYDPCIPHRSTPPEPADLVICTDVLEHIEFECLDDVLDDLARLTKRLVFLEVATRPAVKFLPDGRNAHLIQEQAPWWLPSLCARWNIQSFQNMGGSFVFLGLPLPKYPHFFADHQHCLKCGKSETEPEADDCPMSIEEYDARIRAKKEAQS